MMSVTWSSCYPFGLPESVRVGGEGGDGNDGGSEGEEREQDGKGWQGGGGSAGGAQSGSNGNSTSKEEWERSTLLLSFSPLTSLPGSSSPTPPVRQTSSRHRTTQLANPPPTLSASSGAFPVFASSPFLSRLSPSPQSLRRWTKRCIKTTNSTLEKTTSSPPPPLPPSPSPRPPPPLPSQLPLPPPPLLQRKTTTPPSMLSVTPSQWGGSAE